MASRLTPCPSCNRHVKVGPPACPFCGGAVPTDVAPRTVSLAAGKPLTRAALMFAGAAAVGACSSSSGSPPIEGTFDAAYGVAVGPPDAQSAGLDAAYGVAVGPPDATVDVTQPMASYGVAIIPDAGGQDAPTAFDAAYGVAVGPPDASPDGTTK